MIDKNKKIQVTDQTCFTFDCHPGISCFTDCCNDVDMTLYPYDIIRLKNRLNIESEQFLTQFADMDFDEGCWFPRIKLKLSDNNACPFLQTSGCSVYEDRPYACRVYPLAHSVMRACSHDDQQSKYFLIRHDYCRGHEAPKLWKLSEWIFSSGLKVFNEMNAQWITVDTLLKSYPFGHSGMNVNFFKLLFCAAYNPDNFRDMMPDCLTSEMNIPKQLINDAKTCDISLMKVGFMFIIYCLTGDDL